jgi:AsmA protein
MDVTARNGRLTVAPVLAAVHGGRIEAAAALWQEETPRASLRLSLAGVRVGPLLDELAGRGLLDGRAQLRAELSAAGVDRAAMLRSLAGTAALQVSDGRLRGVDITALFREAGRAPAVAGGEATPAPAGETGFSDLRIGFAIRDAIARSSDLAMRSPLLRVGGEGSVDLAAGTIDYLLRPTLVASLAGQGGRAVLPGLTVPIRVRGPLASPGFAVEWSALLPGALQRPIGQLRERLPEAPGRAIRNLLDR